MRDISSVVNKREISYISVRDSETEKLNTNYYNVNLFLLSVFSTPRYEVDF